MAFFMKVLQIQGIIKNLFNRITIIVFFANFKLYQEYNPIIYKDIIDSLANTGYCVFEYDIAILKVDKFTFKNLYFFFPRIFLQVLRSITIIGYDFAKNRIVISFNKISH